MAAAPALIGRASREQGGLCRYDDVVGSAVTSKQNPKMKTLKTWIDCCERCSRCGASKAQAPRTSQPTQTNSYDVCRMFKVHYFVNA